MNEESDFSHNVQLWTQRIVADGVSDFGLLVGRLPGVDPVRVAGTLAAMAAAVPSPEYSRLNQQARAPRDLAAASDWGPFVPHPLDFDWRFTSNTIKELSRMVVATARPARVALLGTPSLVPSLMNQAPNTMLRLFERNPLWAQHLSCTHPNLEVLETDLTLEPIPPRLQGWADAVVADPPWYTAAQEAYMHSAAQLLRPQGIVVASIPPIGTRPAIASEREALNAQAESLGFTPLSIHAQAVRYRTPPFETNAMRAAGIMLSLPEWRSGDVAVYRLTNGTASHRPLSPATPEPAWAEVCIEGVRIRIKHRNSAEVSNIGAKLSTLVDGDVLPSVSARHPLRAEVDVWTSGNRIFKCEDSEFLIELCRNMSDNTLIDFARPRGVFMDEKRHSHLSPTERKLASIVSIELNEYVRNS